MTLITVLVVLFVIFAFGLSLEFSKLFDHLSGIKNGMDGIERKLDEITTTLREVELNTSTLQNE